MIVLLSSKIFSNKAILGTVTILVASLALCEKVTAFTIKADTRLSQFDNFKSHEIVLPDVPGTLSRRASSEVFSDNRDVRAIATASATQLEAGLINEGNGIHIPSAHARFDDVLFKIIYSQALEEYASIGPFGVLLNFDVSYELDTPKEPARSRQSTADLSATLLAGQTGFRKNSTRGRATIANGSSFYRNYTSGFLENLPASIGSTNVSLYVPLRLQEANDIFIETSGYVDISGLALRGGQAFSKGGVVLSYDSDNFITSSDGRSLDELGIDYMSLADNDTATVPTPALLPGLLSLGYAVVRKGKQESR